MGIVVRIVYQGRGGKNPVETLRDITDVTSFGASMVAFEGGNEQVRATKVIPVSRIKEIVIVQMPDEEPVAEQPAIIVPDERT